MRRPDLRPAESKSCGVVRAPFYNGFSSDGKPPECEKVGTDLKKISTDHCISCPVLIARKVISPPRLNCPTIWKSRKASPDRPLQTCHLLTPSCLSAVRLR